MSTIRDQKSGAILDVDDDGRRLTFEVANSEDHHDECDCDCEGYVSVTFDKAELLALLGGKP